MDARDKHGHDDSEAGRYWAHGLRIAARTMMRALGFGAVMALVFLLGAAPAKSAPPPNADPSLMPWFKSLQRPDGAGSCCSTADCRRVQSRLEHGGYQVLLDGFWVPVPPGNVLRRDNPTGEAIVCERGHVIFCFVPAPET